MKLELNLPLTRSYPSKFRSYNYKGVKIDFSKSKLCNQVIITESLSRLYVLIHRNVEIYADFRLYFVPFNNYARSRRETTRWWSGSCESANPDRRM